MNSAAQFYLAHVLVISLSFGALAGMVLAGLLIWRPRVLVWLGQVANRWVSVRFVSLWLDRSVDLEHWFYRHHRPLGIAVLCGALYVFSYFGVYFDKAALLLRLGSADPRLEGLVDAMVLTALTASTVAIWVALHLWLRPSGLRSIERQSNTWVSSRRATRSLDVQHLGFDAYVLRHAQGVGWLLMAASLGLCLLLLRWWL